MGDVYAARLLGLATARLGLAAWKDAVRDKLKTLDDIYRFAVDQTTMDRGEVLELAIVLILVFELVLFFMGIMTQQSPEVLMKRRDFLRLTTGMLPAGLASPRLAPAEASARRRRSTRRAADPDYVIVGAGSSGSVLAHRLSADPDGAVVVLEAGVSGETDPAVTTPGRWVSLLGSSYDWNYRTEPVAGLGDRRIAFPRGKALGGSSAINAMAHIRGHRLCFDRWLELGNPGWGYDDVLPLFKRSEHNESGPSEFRGGDGPLAVSYCWDPHDAHRAFLTAAIHAGYRSDARFDFNAPNPVGVAGYYQKNILDGRRHSAAAAFLVPAIVPSEPRGALARHRHAPGRGRHACGGRRVSTRRTTRGGPCRARSGARGRGRGFAPAADAFGNRTRRSLEGQRRGCRGRRTGRRAEPPGSPEAVDPLEWPDRIAWIDGHRRPVHDVGIDVAADLQFYVGRGLEQPDRFITITVSLVRPGHAARFACVGDPWRRRYSANYLQEQADVDALVHGVKPRSGRMSSAYEPLRATKSTRARGHLAERSAALRAPRRPTPFTTPQAPAGWARPGCAGGRRPRAARARRAGLRVADASIMPEVVNATTHAACVMIGEKAADLLKAARGVGA